jgi:hypothetical protein
MSKIPLYFIGPATGVLILIIGVLISLLTGSKIDPISILGIAFGIALVTEFCVIFSVLEEEEKP